eukprot:gene5450-6795_t
MLTAWRGWYFLGQHLAGRITVRGVHAKVELPTGSASHYDQTLGGSDMRKSIYLKSTILGAAVVAIAAFAAPAQAAGVGACLITKTDTNPFFVKMKEGAVAKAKELGVDLKTYAGKIDGDSESQVAAIETCIADGAKGILITASDTAGIVSSVKQARDAGVLVIALDTTLDPIDAADATFATDNLLAGELVGKWAAGTLGDKAKDAKIAFLDLTPSQPSVDVQRDQGFMKGFGIDVGDINKIGDEKDPRIVGHDKDPGVNVVYTINEPAAAGAHEALKAFGKDKGVLLVSIDGGCPGVKNVEAGIIGATSQQYPLMMASLGIEAIKKFADTGEKPKPTAGKSFFDTGVSLVTDKPVKGVESIDVKSGLAKCWG